jgi:serine/threonine protein kinase
MTAEYTGKILAGKYELLEQIGAGGMGMVYKALNKQMGNIVCVKVLRHQVFDSQEAVRRLHREAQALGALSHPGILRVLAFDRDDQMFFLVTEYVEGRSLSDIISAEGALAPERIRPLFQQIAEALGYAHSQKIIHRDLKPSNIMIAQVNGVETAKILDFGLARTLDDEKFQRMTRTGALLGTPQYMSPEQCSGASVDASSDIYSLGCMLFEALTGMPPFVGDSAMAVLYQHMEESAPSLPPSDLANVALRCMEKNPADRFASSAELEEAIRLGYKPVITQRKSRQTTRIPKISMSMLAAVSVSMLILFSLAVLVKPGFFPGTHLSTDSRSAEQIFDDLEKIEVEANSREFDLVNYEKGLAELSTRDLDYGGQSRVLRLRAIRSTRLHQFDASKDFYRDSIAKAHDGNVSNTRALFELIKLLQTQHRTADVTREIEAELSFNKSHRTIDSKEVLQLLEILASNYIEAPPGATEEQLIEGHKKAIPVFERLTTHYDGGTVRHADATAKLARSLILSKNPANLQRGIRLVKEWKQKQVSYEHLALAENQIALAEVFVHIHDPNAAEKVYKTIPAITAKEKNDQKKRAELEARALHGLACLARYRSDPAAQAKYAAEGLEIAKRTDQPQLLLDVLQWELNSAREAQFKHAKS